MASTTENRYASIYIDGNAANDTLKNLRKSSTLLKNELNQLPRSSEEFAKKADLLKEVEERLASLKNEARGLGSSFSRLKNELGDIAKGMLAGFSVAGAIEAGRKIISQNAELSDSFAGVMKTTGLTLVEVESLNRSLSRLNTRTAKEELLGLAQVAGKLGISDLKEVEGFVRAADMIGVALGEDLGGTEQAVNSLGKLADIFKLKDEYGIEEALLKIGSAINSLGAAGTATEANLIDFSTRLAGIAPSANISISDVLGLAATLDGLGQSMEKGSTAIGKFLVEMGSDIPKFAKIAKMEVSDFAKLLNTDANEAFLRVLEKSNASAGGIQALAKSMKDLEVKDAGAVQALGALAGNIDKVRESQQLGSEEMEKGTSIVQEFETANNNLAGNLEKIWNKINLIWENSSIRNGLTKLTEFILNNKTATDEASLSYKKNQDELERLSKEYDPLIEKYDELANKGNLNAQEQNELRKVMEKLSAEWPIAVTELDSYGNALGLNTDLIKQNIAEHRNYLRFMNDEAIKEIKLHKERQERLAETLRIEIKNKKSLSASPYGGGPSYANLTNDDLKEKQAMLIEVEEGLRAINYQEQLMGVDGYKPYDTKAMENHSAKVLNDKDAIEKRIKALRESINSEKLTAEQFKETEQAITILTNRLKTLDQVKGTSVPETETESKKGKGSGRKTELERETERNKELYDKLLKEDAAFKLAMDIANESWWKKQLADEEAKYQKQIDKWEEFLNKKHLSKEQKAEAESAIDKLSSDKEVALTNLKVKLEAEATEKIEELRKKLNSKLLTERAKEEQAINDYYESLKKKFEGNPEMQAKIEENRTIDLNDAKLREEKRFHEEAKKLREMADLAKLSGNAKEVEETKSKINAELEALRLKYSDELISLDEFLAAEQAIRDRYAAEADRKEEERKEKKQKELRSMAIDIAQSTSDAIFSITSSNAEAELQAKLNRLDTAREQELKAANLTESQKRAINDKYDAMARKEKERAFKAQQKADIIQAGINTALAFTRALPNWINAAAVAAAGAAQVAVIAAKPVPQYFHGGYTGDQPKGWVRKPTIFANSASGRAFSAGENNMAEYVVSSEQLRDPLIADFVAMMESGRRNEVANLMPQTTIVQNPTDNSRLEGLMMQMIKAYNESSDKKVVLVYHEFEEMRDKKVNIEFGANA